MTKKRTKLKIIIGFLILMISFSCSRGSKIKFYSLDKDNCVTVLTKDTLRYVIAGDYDKVPDTNFVKLDISKITELGDGVWICWLENQGWDIVVDKSIIIENKLDTVKYRFDTNLPVDEREIPTEIKFRQENCAIFDYYLMKLSPDKGAIVEIN
ncbi:hypothetical protein [Labilibaculum antarcticum]|nr:hypothetical protein [Labilibaculum antarcticum]